MKVITLFFSLVVFVAMAKVSAHAQSRHSEPYDGPEFVKKQIPYSHRNVGVDIRKNGVKWGHLGPFVFAGGFNMRYRGRTGGQSPRITVKNKNFHVISNGRVNHREVARMTGKRR